MQLFRFLLFSALACGSLLAQPNCPAINFLHPSRSTTYITSTNSAAALEHLPDGSFTRQRYSSLTPYPRQDTITNYQSQIFACIGSTRSITAPQNTLPLDLPGASSRNPVITDLTGTGISVVLLVGVTGPNDLFIGIVNPDRTTKSFQIIQVGPNPTSILVADFNGDGKRDVAVVNSGNGSTPGSVSVLIGNGDGTLRSPVNYAVGVQPMFATAIDLSGDGRPDLAVTNFADSTVSVLVNNGTGFAAAAVYSTGLFPMGIAAADLNGDAKPDLITANNGGSYSVLVGTGAGVFQSANNYPAPLIPVSIATGDFNKDGKIDLALTDSSPGTIAILNGVGDGTFTPAGRYVMGNDPNSLSNPGSGTLMAMDFDGDGNLDLIFGAGHPEAITGSAFHQDLLVLFGRGDGSFVAPPAFGTGSTATVLAIGDFNGDGKQDLAMASQQGRVTVLTGQGGDRFLATDIDVRDSGGIPGSFTGIATGDVNKDGRADLIITDDTHNDVWVLLASAGGGFGVPTRSPVGGSPSFVAAGDLNGDGKADVVVANSGSGSVSVLLSNGDGTFQPASNVIAGSLPVHVALADVNNDGKLDLIVTNRGTNNSANDPGSVTIMLGNGAGGFTTAATLGASRNPVFTAVEDINRDGKKDLVVATGSTATGYSLSVFLGNGNGTFQTGTPVTTEGKPTSIVIADMNGDGKKDLVVAHCCGDTKLTTLVGNGDGTFQAEIEWIAGDSPLSVVSADFNGDGRPDIAVGNTPVGSKGLISVMLNISGGNLPTCTYSLGRNAASSGAQGDLLSILVTASDSSCGWTVVTTTSWITPLAPASGLGSGNGRFTVAANTGTIARSGSITIAGITMTITQPASGCSFAVNPAAVVIPAAGGPSSVAVTTAAACAWTPTASGSWITVTGSGVPVVGSGSVGFFAPANPGTLPRTATVNLAGVIVQVIQNGSAQAQVFDDVPPSHPYFSQITIMKNKGITTGCSPTTYCPDASTTRGQMAVFIIRALSGGDTFTYTGGAYFTDVPTTHPYFKYIQKMRDLGITVGCSATMYCPDSPVTRGQMAVFLIRARLGITSADTFPYPPAQFFTDVPTTHPYFSYIQKMKEQGITVGCSATTYCPDDPNTRGQMSVFLTRGLLTQ